MKRILVTGAAGLIGSNFVEYLSKSFSDVMICAIDNLSGGNNIPLESERLEFYTCDVESEEFINIFKRFKPDIVYHMAAYAAEGLSPFIRKFNYTNNLVATTNVVNCCIQYGVERLVFLSSMAVYGNQHSPPFHEEFIPNPIDPYGIAKYACEMDIRVAGDQHGLDWCIIRPHNFYGAKQNIWDQYRNVIGIWMRQHLDGKPMTVFGDGQQIRAFSYVGDAMRPLWLAGISPRASKEIINLGGITPTTILDAAKMLNITIGTGSIIHLEGRHEVRNAYSTWQKSIDILEFADKTPLYLGMQKMWEWAREAHRDNPGKARVWDKYEVDKNIYSFWK